MIYRDSTEQCPRCGTDLIDARAARGCESSGGLWIGAGDVQEMVQQMQNPPVPLQLPFQLDSRQPLPCPTCTELMRTMLLYDVPIDACTKHGVWFDAQELAKVLLRAARVST